MGDTQNTGHAACVLKVSPAPVISCFLRSCAFSKCTVTTARGFFQQQQQRYPRTPLSGTSFFSSLREREREGGREGGRGGREGREGVQVLEREKEGESGRMGRERCIKWSRRTSVERKNKKGYKNEQM